MGLHFMNQALQDTTLDVEKPEILVYEKMADGSVRLNGVEYVVAHRRVDVGPAAGR